MRYGKVVNDQITNWLDVKSGDSLKIQKATSHGYLPEEDIPPAFTEYEKLIAGGWEIQADRLKRLYSVVSKSQEEIDAINERKSKAEAISTNLPVWGTVETAIDNIGNIADAKAFLKKLSRSCYVHIKDSLT